MLLNRGRFVQFAGAASLAPLARTKPAAAQTLQTLRVLTVRTDAVKTLLWAQQQGMFAAHGLAIDLVNTGSSSASLSALVGGSAEIAAGSLFSTFTAIAKSIPVK